MFNSNPLKNMKDKLKQHADETLGLSKPERAQNQEEEPYHRIDQARAEVVAINARASDEPRYERDHPDLSEEDAA